MIRVGYFDVVNKGNTMIEGDEPMIDHFHLFRKFWLLLAAALAVATPLGLPLASEAEQRCNDLGANCVCSEPLNTNAYTLVTSAYWAANDTTAKKCSIEGVPNAILEDGSGFRYQAVNSGEAINALPPGRTTTWVLTTKNDSSNTGGGGQFIGVNFPSNSPTARIAFRGYRYWSPTYTFTNETSTCANSSKIIQLGPPGPILDGPSGNHQMYSWTNSPPWNLGAGFDCCWVGPGPTNVQGSYDSSRFRGKWFRFEVIVRNALTTGSATIIEIYRKNVTDNTPEEKIIDTSMPTTQPVGQQWGTTQATTLKPGSRVTDIWFDLFRRDVCSGYIGLSHIIGAAWDTDAGQRIGPAAEIEGGVTSGGGVAPSPPQNPAIR